MTDEDPPTSSIERIGQVHFQGGEIYWLGHKPDSPHAARSVSSDAALDVPASD